MIFNISVIICCYNSASRLPETLRHLSSQEVQNDITWEVILVDNNSTDDTSTIANALWRQYHTPAPLRIVNEPQAGLSHARKKGVHESIGEYIIFCDDDNWLDYKYLATAHKLMHSNPEIGVLAGRGEAVSDVELPYWFHSYQGSYAVGVLALNSGDVTNNKWVWGAGMIIRKQVFLNLANAGFSHITLDRVKEYLSSGGDNEICYWHILAGYKLWYDENLVFKHWMPANRLTKEYYLRLKAAQNLSSQALNIYIRHINAKLYKASRTSKINLIKVIILIAKYLLKISNDIRVFYLYPNLSFILNQEDKKIFNATNAFLQLNANQ